MIRHAMTSDAQAIARIQNASWRATYRNVIWQETLDRLDTARMTQGWLSWFMSRPSGSLCLVATDAENRDRPSRVIGYVMARATPGAQSVLGDAEIQVLYLDPAHCRMGTGRQLVAASARGLEILGFRSLRIWSLANNPSRPFYDRLGGTVIDQRPTRLAGQTLHEVCYYWPRLVPLIAMRADVVLP